MSSNQQHDHVCCTFVCSYSLFLVFDCAYSRSYFDACVSKIPPQIFDSAPSNSDEDAVAALLLLLQTHDTVLSAPQSFARGAASCCRVQKNPVDTSPRKDALFLCSGCHSHRPVTAQTDGKVESIAQPDTPSSEVCTDRCVTFEQKEAARTTEPYSCFLCSLSATSPTSFHRCALLLSLVAPRRHLPLPSRATLLQGSVGATAALGSRRAADPDWFVP